MTLKLSLKIFIMGLLYGLGNAFGLYGHAEDVIKCAYGDSLGDINTASINLIMP